MNPETIIAQLEQINAWRRGDETVGQPAPGHFGDVLDAAAESLASLVASNTTLRRERREARGELKQRKADVTRMEEYLHNSGRNMDEAQEQIAGRDSKIVTLSADLARVTAERDDALYREQMLRSSERNLLEIEAFKDAQLVADQNELSALRARNADLEQSKRTVDFLCELHGCCPEMVLHWCEFEHRQLARAESATPAKHPDTEIVDWLDAQFQSGDDWCRLFPLGNTIREAYAARKQGGEK